MTNNLQDFEPAMKDMQECLHTIANQVMSDIERHLNLPVRWFEENFEHVGNYSQWHLKRYVCGPTTTTPEGENNGIVNNITAFGCFVDVGIKESGLVHISQLKAGFVSDVNEVVKLHQQLQVKVVEVDEERKRIQLTMIL